MQNGCSAKTAFRPVQTDPQRLPNLDLLLAFEAAARHLSFTKAGAERALTQSAISRQVAALEHDLGVLLFRRKHRALGLTDEGQRLAEASRSLLAGLREVVADLRAPKRRQVLALTTTPGFASLWLIPRLPRFVQAHPGIDVRIDASFEQRQLVADGFDLAVRYGRIGTTAGRALFGEVNQPVCAPGLARRSGHLLRTPADLCAHTLLQMANVMAPGASHTSHASHASAKTNSAPLEWVSWLQAVGLPDLEPAAAITFSNYDDVIRAALAGQGVALGRRPLIDALIKQRKLVTPFKGEWASARGYFLVMEPQAARKPAVKALAQWLLDEAVAQDA